MELCVGSYVVSSVATGIDLAFALNLAQFPACLVCSLFGVWALVWPWIFSISLLTFSRGRLVMLPKAGKLWASRQASCGVVTNALGNTK